MVIVLLILGLFFVTAVYGAPAFLVFGDSLVDNGNNNFLFTIARADLPPYGIDSPSHRPTGRFSNGLNIPDIISERMGSEPVLPYLSPELTDEKLPMGANFASAGVGILNDTGYQFKLYEMGVRRAILLGTGPLGCAPAEIAWHSLDGECSADLQAAAELYEPQLAQMVKNLNAELGSDVFIAANTRLMHNDIITNPQAYGFEYSKTACCERGLLNLFSPWSTCSMISKVCENRDKYVFWDDFHPSERACRLIVEKMMNGTDEYMRPMNLSKIMDLHSRL